MTLKLNQPEIMELLDQAIRLMGERYTFAIREPEGNYLYAGPFARQAFVDSGVVKDGMSIIGMNIREIYPEDYQAYIDNDAGVLKKDRFITFHEHTHLLTQEYNAWVVKKGPLRIQNKVVGVIALSRYYNSLSTSKKDINYSIRQLQIISASFYGLSSKEIAKKLKLSPRTVEDHLTRLKDKVGFEKKSELHKFVVDNDLEHVVRFFSESYDETQE